MCGFAVEFAACVRTEAVSGKKKLRIQKNIQIRVGVPKANGEFKKTTTVTATGMSLNKSFNEQNNGCARAL